MHVDAIRHLPALADVSEEALIAVDAVYTHLTLTDPAPYEPSIYDAYRFARARKYNVEKAVAMYREMCAWRESFGPHRLSLESSGVREALQRDVAYFVGRCRAGYPTVVIYAANHFQANTPLELYVQSTVLVVERVLAACLAAGVQEVNVIADYQRFGYSNMDLPALRAFMSLQNYYPERLHQAFIVNAPWTFKAVWKVASALMDERTKGKVHLLGSDYATALAEYYDPSQLPDSLGGTGDFPLFSQDVERALASLTMPRRVTFSDKVHVRSPSPPAPPSPAPPARTSSASASADGPIVDEADASAVAAARMRNPPSARELAARMRENAHRNMPHDAIALCDQLDAALEGELELDDAALTAPWLGECPDQHEAMRARFAPSEGGGFCTDRTLYRFLVARQFNVDKAASMLRACLAWRESFGVGELSHEDARLQAVLATGKVYLHYYDRSLRPCFIVHMARHTKSANVLPTVQLMVVMIETALRWSFPPHHEFCVIADFRGSGLRNYELGLMRAMLDILLSHYPEQLHAVYIVDAPWAFSGIWHVIRALMDERTTRKVRFLDAASFAETLLHHFDPPCLPTSLGGASSFDYERACSADRPLPLGALFPIPFETARRALEHMHPAGLPRTRRRTRSDGAAAAAAAAAAASAASETGVAGVAGAAGAAEPLSYSYEYSYTRSDSSDGDVCVDCGDGPDEGYFEPISEEDDSWPVGLA